MNLKTRRFRLPLARPFTISRGTLIAQDAIVVSLDDGEHTGLGEVTANTYYGHSVESIEASIEKAKPAVESFEFGTPDELWQTLKQVIGDDTFAMAAIDLAVQDLHAKKQGKKCFEVWGLDASSFCESSYTIAIDPIDVMIEKLKEFPDWSVYKIKLGVENDIEMVRQLRQHTNSVFRVDANCGWTPDEAIDKSQKLAELNVEFIEQPLPADAPLADKKKVFEQSVLPIVADENCLGESDVAKCRDFFHGINVKLCKCGGLTPALRMLKQARAFGMKTMVGCMIESSIGISANAQLLPLLDYADLDGAILLGRDPASGVTIQDGIVEFSNQPGLGATINEPVHPDNQWQPAEGQAEAGVN